MNGQLSVVAFLDLFLVIHSQKLSSQNWCVCSPTCINYKIEIFSWICRQSSIFFGSFLSIAGSTESNGTCIGEFPPLVLGTAVLYHIFFQFAGNCKFGSARLLRSLTCALDVLFLFCPVWGPLDAAGSGVIRHSSISCRIFF